MKMLKLKRLCLRFRILFRETPEGHKPTVITVQLTAPLAVSVSKRLATKLRNYAKNKFSSVDGVCDSSDFPMYFFLLQLSSKVLVVPLVCREKNVAQNTSCHQVEAVLQNVSLNDLVQILEWKTVFSRKQLRLAMSHKEKPE